MLGKEVLMNITWFDSWGGGNPWVEFLGPQEMPSAGSIALVVLWLEQ